MKDPIGFLSNAKGFIRNPLGIMALFVSFVYGMACLVIDKGLEVFDTPNERLWLILFIVFYPVLLLLAFVSLIVYDPVRLYAPSDFRNERLFLEHVSGKTRKERMKEEVEEIVEAKEEEQQIDKSAEKNISVAEKEKRASDLMIKLQRVERASLLALNRKYGVELSQGAMIGKKKQPIYCDGYQYKDGIHYIAEVKYLPNSTFSYLHRLLQTVYRMIAQLRELRILSICEIMVCVVYEKRNPEFEQRVRKELGQIYEGIKVDFYEANSILH